MNWHFRTKFLLALSAIYLIFGFAVDSSFSATTSPAPTIVTRFTFTLPLSGETQINAYFDLNNNVFSITDVSGWQCQMATSTVVDQNGDGKINSTDFNHAFEKACPWKIGHAYDNHQGVDFQAKTGTDVFAAAAGTVTAVEDKWADNEHPWQEGKHPLAAAEKDRSKKGSFGNLIVIQNDVDGSYAYYGHLQAVGIAKYGIKIGDKVERGQLIATADNTGSSRSSRGDMYGDHLHFEIRDSSKPKQSANILDNGKGGAEPVISPVVKPLSAATQSSKPLAPAVKKVIPPPKAAIKPAASSGQVLGVKIQAPNGEVPASSLSPATTVAPVIAPAAAPVILGGGGSLSLD